VVTAPLKGTRHGKSQFLCVNLNYSLANQCFCPRFVVLMFVGGNHKLVLRSVLAFAFCVMLVWSCKRRDPLPGCAASFKGLQCKIGDVIIIADSSGVDYDTVRRRVSIFAKDDIKGFKILIEINAPLQNFDLTLSNVPNVYGKGRATVLKDGNVYVSKYGNVGINIDATQSLKTVCGQFFMQDGGDFLISQGEFRALPIRYTF
jgi:hypothetical protein